MKRSIFLVCTLVLFSGCLKTRADLRGEDSEPQRQTVAQQRAERHESTAAAKPPPATTASRFEEVDEQMRAMNGRLDVVENSLSQLAASKQGETATQARERQAQEQRLLLYEDAIKKLESQVLALTAEVERLKTAPPPAAAAGSASARNPYEEAEALFDKKKWKESIVAYQKYRDANPKGRHYADATYKIGVAFHELGLKDEARAFYEEVTSKYPGSKEAKKAAVRMKQIK